MRKLMETEHDLSIRKKNFSEKLNVNTNSNSRSKTNINMTIISDDRVKNIFTININITSKT